MEDFENKEWKDMCKEEHKLRRDIYVLEQTLKRNEKKTHLLKFRIAKLKLDLEKLEIKMDKEVGLTADIRAILQRIFRRVK